MASDGPDRTMAGSQMQQQLSLDLGGMAQLRPPPVRGHDPHPRSRCDLFFAVLPEARIAEQASALAHDLRKTHRLRAPPRPANLLHATLCCVGAASDLPDIALSAVRRAAETVAMKRFTLELTHFLSFRQGQQALVLCGDKGDRFCLTVVELRGKMRKPENLEYLGKTIVDQAKPAGKNVWKGKLDLFGVSGDATITLKNANTLHLKACAYVVVCKEITLTRKS